LITISVVAATYVPKVGSTILPPPIDSGLVNSGHLDDLYTPVIFRMARMPPAYLFIQHIRIIIRLKQQAKDLPVLMMYRGQHCFI
jgi:hypothetical protein